MLIPEESAGRPRRAARSAQAKSTMGKLGAPKAVGLPKPPQILAKVREFMFACLHCLLDSRRREELSYIVHFPMCFRFRISTNRRLGIWCMPGEWGRWQLLQRQRHRRRNERPLSISMQACNRVLSNSSLGLGGVDRIVALDIEPSIMHNWTSSF